MSKTVVINLFELNNQLIQLKDCMLYTTAHCEPVRDKNDY